jgi:hypothetical protein
VSVSICDGLIQGVTVDTVTPVPVPVPVPDLSGDGDGASVLRRFARVTRRGRFPVPVPDSDLLIGDQAVVLKFPKGVEA